MEITSAVASGHGGPRPWLELLAATVLIGAAVTLSRRRPVVALCVPIAGYLLQALMSGTPMAASTTTTGIVVAAMGYLAGRRADRARPVLVAVAAFAVTGALLSVVTQLEVRGAFGVVSGLYDGLAVTLVLLVTAVLPWLVGRYLRQRAALITAGWERAELLERQQQVSADRARLRERARIAQDMHDSLGHELSLIALRASALTLAPDVGADSRAAAGELRSSVATATERLREVIGVLRPDGADAPAQPPRTHVAELVEQARRSGMVVTLEGDPTVAADTSVMIGRAAYRVVQEVLTNSAKHAPGAAVTVRLSRSPDETVVTVVNGPPTRATSGSGGGHGLVGLRERARVLGGTLRWGPRDGGFEVIARLPHATDSAAVANPGDTMVGADPGAGPTESARVLKHARRRVRRRLITAIVAPVAIGGVIAVLVLSLQLSAGLDNRLALSAYERLWVGQQRPAVERVLPTFQIVDVPPAAGASPPEGTVCQYYWSSVQTDDVLFFRLCFAGDRLATKDALSGSVQAPTRASAPG